MYKNDRTCLLKTCVPKQYINHEIFTGDNGRVLGYDNTHNYHHRHYLGEISVVEDFMTYENLVNRFEQEIGEFIR
jgi:hypothetical protein